MEAILRVPELGILLALVFAVGVFAAINTAFVDWTNIQSILRTIAFIGIVAIGQAMLIVSGEFDLSVGSVAALAAVVGGLLMTSGGMPIPVAIVLAIAVGLVAGAINGVLTVLVGLPALIVTLGMLFAARGLTYVVSSGDQVYPLPKGVDVLAEHLLGLPMSVWCFAAIALLAELAMRRSGFGRRLYATGGNPEAATLAGIRPARIRIAAFVITGGLAALAGVLVMAQLHSGDPQIGTNWELAVIAAVVVGGISLRGGIGTIAGALLGVLFLQVVSSGLVIAGLEATLQPVAVGVVMIAALGLDQVRHRRYGR